MTGRLLYFVSHPIQYQAPLLRRIAGELDIDLRVVFERVHPDHRSFDPGFGRDIRWDVSLTDGYDFAAAADIDPETEIGRANVVWFHGWETPFMRRTLRLAARRGVPVLMRGENCDMAMPDGPGIRGWLKRKYIGRIFDRCAAFLAIGTENRTYYMRRGVSADRIFEMPYAVDNRYFADRAAAAQADREVLRNRLGIPGSAPVILFAGKFQARKKPDLLARAAADTRWPAGRPALVFVGDGELRQDLERLAPDAAFAGFVNQSDLPAYYGLADVFVLPSEREPWGLAVNEAMACGTPVVVSDQVGCAADLVTPATGRVFAAGNADALAAALADCLENARQLGDNARKHIDGWSFDQDIDGLGRAIAAVTGRT